MNKYHSSGKTDLLRQHKSNINGVQENFRNGKISPLEYDDIGEVARMSQIYFEGSKELSITYLCDTLEELYFKNQFTHPGITSLVSRSNEGLLNGFLGVTTHPFHYKDREIIIANCHHLMATEAARAMLIPMKILQKFLSGPQDVSFADGSVESTRQLWKRLGGEPSIGDSLYYKIPLRPVSFALRPFLKQFNKPLSKMAKLFASGTDATGSVLRLPLFRCQKTHARLIPLTSSLLIEALAKLKNLYSIFPDYEQLNVDRLFRLLTKGKMHGTLHKIAIIDEIEGIIGWFIYYSQKGSVCEVIQAVSVPGKENLLFDSLKWHAYMHGGVELSGRLMAQHLRTSFTSKAVNIPARMWTLIHSSDVELMHQIQSGKAFLTRLEGDLWLI
jgi:hypothetical protein